MRWNKEDWKVFRRLFISFSSVAAWMIIYWLFLSAWFKGGKATVDINYFNEALIEFIFVPIYLVVLIAFIIIEVKKS